MTILPFTNGMLIALALWVGGCSATSPAIDASPLPDSTPSPPTELGTTNAGLPPEPDATTDSAPPPCFISISAGGHHTCALKGNGSLWCWGANNTAQLNDDSEKPSPIPKRIFDRDIVQVHTGGQHNCVVKRDDSVWCWGWNSSGQLGTGLNTSHELAFKLFDGGEVLDLGLGSSAWHTCVRRGDRSIWCWGHNPFGQVGDGSKENVWIPTKVLEEAEGPPVLGGGFTCARRVNGNSEYQCWGSNTFGQLGHNGMDKLEPAPAIEGVRLAMLAAGGTTSCGIDADGNLFCWGDGSRGQLGGMTASWTPIKVIDAASEGAVDAVSVAGNSICALGTDGSLRCWGANKYGQVGDSAPAVARSEPFEVFASGVLAVVTGISHACALKDDQSIWCWGLNRYGQLGTGKLPDEPLEPFPTPQLVDLHCD